MSKQDVEQLLNSLNISLEGICDVEDVAVIKQDKYSSNSHSTLDNDLESWLENSSTNMESSFDVRSSLAIITLTTHLFQIYSSPSPSLSHQKIGFRS